MLKNKDAATTSLLERNCYIMGVGLGRSVGLGGSRSGWVAGMGDDGGVA